MKPASSTKSTGKARAKVMQDLTVQPRPPPQGGGRRPTVAQGSEGSTCLLELGCQLGTRAGHAGALLKEPLHAVRAELWVLQDRPQQAGQLSCSLATSLQPPLAAGRVHGTFHYCGDICTSTEVTHWQ